MTNQTPIKTDGARQTGLELLRAPFKSNQISKLPKPTKRQTDEVKADFKKGIRCKLCGQWHHRDVVHLDYVGHAALTDRLLDCDPSWNWEPVARTEHGTPLIDENGGMWIFLTVCNVTRLGYGHPDGKRGGDAVKELIGDALRNAAMRFGAALDLWHKGDLHGDEPDGGQDPEPPKFNARAASDRIVTQVNKAQSLDDLGALWKSEADTLRDIRAADQAAFDDANTAKDARKAALSQPANTDLGDDSIPF